MPPVASDTRTSVAVIDIGSNSGRVMVFERDRAGHLRLLAGSRASLRLVHDVDTHRQLTEQTMSRTLEALRDFQAIAAGAGASRLVAVATASPRRGNLGRRHRGSSATQSLSSSGKASRGVI